MDHNHALIVQAQTLERHGDIVGALKHYHKAYQTNPNDEATLLGVAQCALAMGRDTLAFDFFVKLLIQNHQNPWGYWGRGNLFFHFGQSKQGHDDLKRAIGLDNPPTTLRVDCAVVYNENACFEQAIQAIAPLDKTLWDEDARIEWTFAKLALGDHQDAIVQAYVTPFLDTVSDDALTETLVSGYLRLRGEASAGTRRKNALQDEDLAWRIEVLWKT